MKKFNGKEFVPVCMYGDGSCQYPNKVIANNIADMLRSEGYKVRVITLHGHAGYKVFRSTERKPVVLKKEKYKGYTLEHNKKTSTSDYIINILKGDEFIEEFHPVSQTKVKASAEAKKHIELSPKFSTVKKVMTTGKVFRYAMFNRAPWSSLELSTPHTVDIDDLDKTTVGSSVEAFAIIVTRKKLQPDEIGNLNLIDMRIIEGRRSTLKFIDKNFTSNVAKQQLSLMVSNGNVNSIKELKNLRYYNKYKSMK